MAVPGASAGSVFPPSDWLVAHPKVQIQAKSTNRRVDVLGEGFDIALRVRFPPLQDENLFLKVFGESYQKLVAKP
ncbi:hypothetical protein PPUN109347_40950 [Pseudomonas putida]|nr:hypothetical protein PPUN109347_40950 [Pseudomonas putida]